MSSGVERASRPFTGVRSTCSSPSSIPSAVDGIAADGIEDGELQVDRTPVKGRLARSTPELIVEKLADENADDGTFYEGLLEKF